MEYGQFIKILEGENLNSKVTVEQLKEIIQQYPYFQSAHILLAKALHEQNNIDYDRVLKIAAVYAGDRSVLFDYINKKEGTSLISTETLLDEPLVEVEREEAAKEVFETKIPEPVVPTPTYIKKEESYTEYFSEEEILGIDEEEEKEETVYDPHDLIRKRLSEILGQPQPVEEVKQEITEPAKPIEEIISVVETPVQPQIKTEEKKEEVKTESKAGVPDNKPVFAEASAGKEQIIAQEAEKAKDPLARMEVEYAMEASILESLEKLPPLPQKPKENIPDFPLLAPKIEKAETTTDATDTLSPRSFTDWLKAVSPNPFHNYTEIHTVHEVKDVKLDEPLLSEEDAPEPTSTEEELIEKFIATEPRIVPTKTEFYSPVNQAKKSLMEHDDVVSETLAKIYRDQGHLDKARWCYHRLMLVHPEKSAFFAALLKEIDEINKEDL